jgi:hypothetical protein
MKPIRATYADLEAVPADKVAELNRGTLYVMPRPAPKHATAASRMTMEIGGPFDRGRGGPGGWRILVEPELRFPDPSERGAFYTLGAGGAWGEPAHHGGADVVRAAPFDAIGLDLSSLWT